ncbi:MAG TPA: hypothetical protein VK184_21180 [Nostocaceae cyanobacterium]|nr:hypothetical protein [Nostocaceae cyanobacterium]
MKYNFNKLFQLFVSFVLIVSVVFITDVKAETLTLPTATTFVVYGDIPYMVKLADGRTDKEVLEQDIAPQIRQRADIPFAIHVGDLGRPQDACFDSWLEESKALWENQIVKPVFFTPGDNDWTDCDRTNLTVRQSELARLDALRRILFSQPKTLPLEWQYEQQSTLPENELWRYKDVLFVSQHYISTNNGREEILLDDPQTALKLVDERDQQNQIWLDHAFNLAKSSDTAAVVVATQLDPFGPPNGIDDTLTRCLNNPAYRDFCVHLQTLASELDKPVLLVHGDTNAYCFDQPFSTAIAPKLWRLNAPGDYKVIDASLVSFDPTSSDQPFKITGLLSGQVPPQVCDYGY